ncbi:MAG: hemolysin III family protein [Clostridium sp.]|nr:hemolysin III family protein [Clostridium sp.]
MKTKLREPINSITHLAGAGVFLIGTILIIAQRIIANAPLRDIIGVTVFGISLVMLYMASGIYHAYMGGEKVLGKLKKLDHSMIYVLIAGCFTHMCLQVLTGTKQVVILSVIWAIALFGIFGKIFMPNVPRVLYTFFYLFMGWIVVFFIGDVYRGVDLSGFILLFVGGVLYSIGGIIYMIKKPNFSKDFGFHEFFHLFILGGSLFHYLFTFFYLTA